MPFISVIIPVYNVADYLHKCVDSVLNQDFKDIEVILVNDGSPDQCPAICDAFAKRDERVVVIHKNNGGSSDARNQGILAAKGTYLMFLDGDDYWEGENCIVNLVNAMRQTHPDVILYGAKDVMLYNKSTTISRGNYNIKAIRENRDAAVKSLFITNHFPASAWILSIKRELVISKKLFFKTGIKAEDIDWLVNVFLHSEKFDAVNDSFYMYIKNRPGALTTTSDFKSAQDILYSVAKWRPVLESKLSETNEYLLAFLSYQYITSFIIYSDINKEQKKMLLPVLLKNKQILKYAKGKRALISKMIISFFGIMLASTFFKVAHLAMNKYPRLKRIM